LKLADCAPPRGKSARQPVTARSRARRSYNSGYLLFDCFFNEQSKISRTFDTLHLFAGCMAPAASVATAHCYEIVFSMSHRCCGAHSAALPCKFGILEGGLGGASRAISFWQNEPEIHEWNQQKHESPSHNSRPYGTDFRQTKSVRTIMPSSDLRELEGAG
jgi:hypothetical protein